LGSGKWEVGRWELEDGRWKMEVGRWKWEVGRWKMGGEISKLFVLKNTAIAQIEVKILFLFSLKRKRLQRKAGWSY
jgi:hypothetical protein